MYKRFIIGFLATGLLWAWMTPEAQATTSRYWRSIATSHTCTDGTCEDGDIVTDRIFGVSVEDDGTIVATCKMTGLVFCDPVVYDGTCPVVENETHLAEIDFVSLDVIIEAGSAFTEAELNRAYGQAICNDNFGFIDEEKTKPKTIFRSFWPQDLDDSLDVPDFVAQTVYTHEDETTTEIKEIGYKPSTANPDGILQAVLTPYTGKLPCCGEKDTLTIIAEGGGTVTSDDGFFDCGTGGTDCSHLYDGTIDPYDGCPSVTLTATPDSGSVDGDTSYISYYEFSGWSGGGCSGTTPTCTTSAKGDPTITATFTASGYTLRVIVHGDGTKDYAYIWSPRSDFDDPAEYYCADICYKRFDPGTEVTIKRKGGTFEKWGGVCEGVPNSVDTCTFTMDKSQSVDVYFIN